MLCSSCSQSVFRQSAKPLFGHDLGPRRLRRFILGSLVSRSLQVSSSGPAECSDGWREVPSGLVFYDYLGHNPAKGRLFRSGAMNCGDGIAIGWLGHALFETGTGQRLFPRRMPSFFDSFPVVLLDDLSVVRAHHPFARAGIRA